METIDCIKSRRSRRKFLDKEVPIETIKKIIESGIYAPCSKNCQPWEFVIVKNKETKEKLAKLKDEDNRKHILTAPVCIIVCVNLEKSPTRHIEDGVTATMNILLAINDLGLDGLYVTGHNPGQPEITKEINSILGLPETIIPITIIPMGYADPSEEIEEKTLLDIEKIIHYEKW